MSKHTPGPWTITNSRHPNWDAIQAETRDDLAVVGIDDTDVDALRETQANARLIAAAPELLAACRDGLHLIEGLVRMGRADGDDEATADRLAAAITKALGLPIDRPAADGATGPVASQGVD